MRTVRVRGCEPRGRSETGVSKGLAGSQSSARGRLGRARLQPALGDGKESGGFTRSKGFVEAEHAAVAAVALSALDREGGAKATAVGRVCRGRNDVLAHGNGGV